MITTLILLLLSLALVWACRRIPDHYLDPEPPPPDSPLDVRVDYWMTLADLFQVTDIDQFCLQIPNLNERRIVRSMLQGQRHVPHHDPRTGR